MRRRRTGMVRIPSEWYKLLPGQTLAFWFRVALVAKRRGISKRNFGRIRALAVQQIKKGD